MKNININLNSETISKTLYKYLTNAVTLSALLALNLTLMVSSAFGIAHSLFYIPILCILVVSAYLLATSLIFLIRPPAKRISTQGA